MAKMKVSQGSTVLQSSAVSQDRRGKNLCKIRLYDFVLTQRRKLRS